MIGENAEHRGRYFNGLIDDVRIYVRALSAGDIQGLYSMGDIRNYGGGMYNESGREIDYI
ncbi:MAG: LamG-like jellyroll fold domain-containing protein [Planctomycetota bacterium]